MKKSLNTPIPKNQRHHIVIVPGRTIWPHEMRVANILAAAGHQVEFLPECNIPTPDIKLDGIEYEIKSPEHMNANTLEHTLKDVLKQSTNIIIDSSRIRNKVRDDNVRTFLIAQLRHRQQIKRLLFITKRGQIVDIGALI